MKARNQGLCIGIALLAGAAMGCNALTAFQSIFGGSSGVPSSVGAAIAAAFSGGQGGAQQKLPPSQNVNGVCDEFDPNSEAEGPEGIQTSNMVEAGTYGPTGFSVTLDGSEDCESDSTNALGFASFEIQEDIVATCDDGGTITLLPGSSGVYRQNTAAGYNPEIYGTFGVRDSDGTVYQGVRCQLLLGENGQVLDANCEDASGNVIDTDTANVTCQFSTN